MQPRPLSLVLFLLAAPPAARAQRPTGRLEGTVTDSMHARPLAGATVLATRLGPDPAWLNVVTDERGRYRLDTLSAGRYSVAFWHPMLDSLELNLPARTVDVADGARVTLDLAVPSRATLLGIVCPGIAMPAGTGALVGRVEDAESERPLPGATVAVRWSDLAVDRSTLQVSGTERAVSGRVAADGQFRFCGLPTDSWLSVQVQRDGHGGTAVQASIQEAAGLAMLNFAYSAEAARPLAAAGDTTRAVAPPAPLAGTAGVSGMVVGDAGQPLPGVQVRVLDTRATARTDSTGRFTMTGLPAGTQVLEAKRLGYRIVQQPVALRAGREIQVPVRLSRVVSLDSIRIVAQRARYREFEDHRKNGWGRYLDEKEIASRNAMDVSDLVWMMPGIRIVGTGPSAVAVSSRGSVRLSGAGCPVNVVIDGMPRQEINWLRPADVGALEVYASGAGAPVQYDSACGLIVIHTKR